MELTVVELFAGVGGFRVGLNDINEFDETTGIAIENKNWKFVWANQWEPSTKSQPAFDCYNKRFGSSENLNIDINKVNKDEIPNHSLLVGGFPCQDYSVARTLSKEKGIKGKKGVLWWDIKDVIKAKKPPFILLENVDRLLKSPASKRGRDFAIMLKTLDELGYMAQWRVINAGEYSMPQKRRRTFIFASNKNTDYSKRIMGVENIEKYLVDDGFFNEIFPVEKDDIRVDTKNLNHYKDILDISDNFKDGKFENSGIMIDGLVNTFKVIEDSTGVYPLKEILKEAKKYNSNDLERYIINSERLKKWEYLKGQKKIPRVSSNGKKYFYSEGQMNFPDDLEVPARTLLTSEGTDNRSSHAVYDKDLDKIRKITEVEAELIQMFPANWTNTGMTSRQRYFMMGNALVTGIINRIEPKLRDIIINENVNEEKEAEKQLNFFEL